MATTYVDFVDTRYNLLSTRDLTFNLLFGLVLLQVINIVLAILWAFFY